MSYRQESGYFNWLTATLTEKRLRLGDLLRRVIGIGAPGGMKPALFRKFLGLMDEVAEEHDKEIRLITQIEAVERKHRFRRDHHQLEEADPDYDADAAATCERQPPKTGMWSHLRHMLRGKKEDFS